MVSNKPKNAILIGKTSQYTNENNSLCCKGTSTNKNKKPVAISSILIKTISINIKIAKNISIVGINKNLFDKIQTY